MARKKRISEFGKGFVYNLILFAKHYERAIMMREKYDMIRKMDKRFTGNEYSNFFYSATDHLYELEIPEQWKRTKIARLTREFHDLCFTYRLPLDNKRKASEKEFDKAIDLLHQISMEIDKKLGIKVIEADNK